MKQKKIRILLVSHVNTHAYFQTVAQNSYINELDVHITFPKQFGIVILFIYGKPLQKRMPNNLNPQFDIDKFDERKYSPYIISYHVVFHLTLFSYFICMILLRVRYSK